MLKNLEIINELHERLVEKGFNKHNKWHDGWDWYNEEAYIKPYYFEGHLIKIITLRLFEDYICFDSQRNNGYHFIVDSASEKYTSGINKILNKVDEWMRK